MPETRDEVIRRWLAARDAAKGWAEQERTLRDFIMAQFGYNPATPALSLPNGTHRFPLGNGYFLKAVVGETLSIKDGPDFDAFVTFMRSYTGGNAKLLQAVNFKPALVKAGYQALAESDPEAAAYLTRAIERKPKAPVLDMEHEDKG